VPGRLQFLKNAIKTWKNTFNSETGREPSIDEIKANPEMLSMHREYKELKNMSDVLVCDADSNSAPGAQLSPTTSAPIQQNSLEEDPLRVWILQNSQAQPQLQKDGAIYDDEMDQEIDLLRALADRQEVDLLRSHILQSSQQGYQIENDAEAHHVDYMDSQGALLRTYIIHNASIERQVQQDTGISDDVLFPLLQKADRNQPREKKKRGCAFRTSLDTHRNGDIDPVSNSQCPSLISSLPALHPETYASLGLFGVFPFARGQEVPWDSTFFDYEMDNDKQGDDNPFYLL
jgi:hypothetical protein